MLKAETKIMKIEETEYILVPVEIRKDSKYYFTIKDKLTIEIVDDGLLIKRG